MSAGTARPAEGRATAVPARADYLGALRHEQQLAADYGDTRRAAELQAQINRASAASTPASPATETTSRPAAAPRRKK